MNRREKFTASLLSWGDSGLTVLLLGLAIVLFLVALYEKNVIVKAATAAWVIFP